ncbi:hypothetical protein FJY68_13755 [candidate division WOR-3 bacterium]|uniref:Uncharacterized protein n=1 Tax=candidate division WOR-3 bacterium TaxID=2052148 RepID=A0A937XKR3_UNCW3|nr:hypothetical protein [candidate division WOR-3 bacterium]
MRNLASVTRRPYLVGRSVGAAVRRHLADDRGVAALEAVLVLLFIAGVLLGIVLLGQWGTHLQYSQMGARLLAFDAGDTTLAKSGRAGDSAVQTFSSSSWDPYGGSLPVGWLNVMFVLPNQRFCGRVSGVQSGRLPGQSPSLFDFSPAALGYSSGACAATNPWSDSGPRVQSQFLGIAYYVGRYRTGPEGLGSVPSIPPGIPLVETILGRVGGVR